MFLYVDSEDSDLDWADAQADLSLRWAQRSFCWFCHEAAQIAIHRYNCTNMLNSMNMGVKVGVLSHSMNMGVKVGALSLIKDLSHLNNLSHSVQNIYIIFLFG